MDSKDQRTKLEKLMALAADPSATPGERAAAREAAARLREKEEAAARRSGKEDPTYKRLVEQGKEACHKREEMNWILGELASKVEKRYGKADLRLYAQNIGVNYTTLRHCYATFVAWAKINERPPFWTAYALNSHPNRFQIVRERPHLTHQEARDIVASYKQEQRQKQGKPPKAKAKGKDKSNPYPVSETSQFIQIIDGLLANGSNLQIFLAEIKPTQEERAQINKALGGLQKRIDDAIRKVRN